MIPSEARGLFSEAFEGDLDEERKRAFDEALMEDEQLDQEYAEFVETFEMVRVLATPESVKAPNLLPRIQERIRRRSGGKYYRDRFPRRAGQPGWMMPVIVSAAVLLVIAIIWFAFQATMIFNEAAMRAQPGAEATADSPASDSPAPEAPNSPAPEAPDSPAPEAPAPR